MARVFGQPQPVVSSIKRFVGHSLGAAGAVELVVSVLAATARVAPPPSPRSTGTLLEAPAVVTTNYAFGGTNSALVIAPAGASKAFAIWSRHVFVEGYLLQR